MKESITSNFLYVLGALDRLNRLPERTVLPWLKESWPHYYNGYSVSPSTTIELRTRWWSMHILPYLHLLEEPTDVRPTT